MYRRRKASASRIATSITPCSFRSRGDHRPVGFAANRRRLSRPHRFRRKARARDWTGERLPHHRDGTARRGRGGRRAPRRRRLGLRAVPGVVPRPDQGEQIAGMPRLMNSFWFNHAANKSKAVLNAYLCLGRECRVGVGAPALSVPDENHLRMREALPVDPHHRALLSGDDRRCCELLPTQENGPGRPGGASARISSPVISASSASATRK